MYSKIIITENDLNIVSKIDNKMKLLIESVGKIDREFITDPFIALVNSIIYQQITYKAALSIWNKFEKIVKNITPLNIYNESFDNLREAGLSKSKILYIKNISKAVIDNQINFKDFNNKSDEEIIEILIKIKGIGRWTAEMFLIFALNRKNIISYNDLGIRKAIKWLYSLKNEPTLKEFIKFKNKFSPYNTIVSFYLWEITIKGYFKYENIEDINNKISYFDSPLGIIEIQSKDEMIISLEFVEKKVYEEKDGSVLIECKKQLNEYFHKKRKVFDLPLKLNGTDFQKKVWNELLNIPYGETCSYKDIAIKINNENASRAVGNANNKNKIAIIIPCHRVIGSNKKLVGYASGLENKAYLINLENNNL